MRQRRRGAEGHLAPAFGDGVVERFGVKDPQPIELSQDYKKNAEQLAKRRASEAGYRLAETWRKALK